MFNLIRLEWNKLRIRRYLMNAALITVILALWCNTNIPDEETRTYSEAFIAINAYFRSTFIVFAAVLLSRLIIDEYRNKTISVVFMYPIPRKKLMTAKLMLVSLFTFSLMVVSNLVALGFFLFMDRRYGFIPETFSADMIAPEIGRIVLYAVGSTGLSLVPIFIGMIRKSVPATLIASFLLAFGFTAFHYETWGKLFLMSAFLAAAGLLMAYLAFRNVDKVDLTD